MNIHPLDVSTRLSIISIYILFRVSCHGPCVVKFFTMMLIVKISVVPTLNGHSVTDSGVKKNDLDKVTGVKNSSFPFSIVQTERSVYYPRD